MHILHSVSVALVAALPIATTACGNGTAHDRGRADSVVPWDTALARFRAASDSVDGLANAAPSLDDLIRQFVTLLEAADTAGLATLAMTRAEFAWLYYPWVPEARPPYDLSPGLMWFMLEGASQRGLRATLEERGGRPLGVVAHECDRAASRELGENTLWPLCVVRRIQAPGDTVTEHLFGPIMERHGRFKFVSLAGKL